MPYASNVRTLPAARGGRMVQLDVLRGVAILLVLCRHPVLPWSFAGPLQPVVLRLYHLGWTGVDLFFVLSGFLIGGLLFDEIRRTNRLDVKRFLIRRAFKIWPAYLVFIAYVFALLAWQHHSAWYALHEVSPNLIHLQNYLHTEGGVARGHTWSLAVEEHFYLALPLFLLAVIGRRRRPGAPIPAIGVAAVALIVLCTGLRLLVNPYPPFDWWHIIAPTHMRIDGLFFGVLLAYVYHFHPRRLAGFARHPWALIFAGLILILPMAIVDQGDRPFVWTIGLTMLYLGYGCILVAFVHAQPGRGLLGKAIASRVAAVVAGIGVFSYSIYLWQMEPAGLLRFWLDRHPPLHHLSLCWLVTTLTYIAGSIVLGVVLSKVIEMPVLALRDRNFPRAPRAVLTPARPARASSTPEMRGSTPVKG
ncbi:MAG TPA: acyltransferase [Tepidisphaeraceae bacterium]